MRILVGERWSDDFQDEHRGPGEYRIAVQRWLTLGRVQGLYFERQRSLAAVAGYVRELGVRGTWQKIRSRRAERGRNQRWLSCGAGVVLEAPSDGLHRVGDAVAFVAPRHPACMERLVLPGELIAQLGGGRLEPGPLGPLELLQADPSGSPRGEPALTDAEYVSATLSRMAGWSPDSGERLGVDVHRAALGEARRLVAAASWGSARRLTRSAVGDGGTAGLDPRDPPVEARSARPDSELRTAADVERSVLCASLFGYGNYAKTVILPSLPKALRVTWVHEIDPLQADPSQVPHATWTSDPGFGDQSRERPDVALIAGFHHTHASLTVEALRRGAAAVVEKPLAVDERQLNALLSELKAPSARLFACFQKRYSGFNELARVDLETRRGEPISYHCIVFEEPLPERHWYRWPRSHSRLVSNGCHWIDHFLFLNAYPATRRLWVEEASDGTVLCGVELENDAVFSMLLTDRGSPRLGVRDHVELRAASRTVTIDDGTRYSAESRDSMLRRTRTSRLDAYQRMYREIGSRIEMGEAGDSVGSIERSTKLVLALEREMLDRRRGRAHAADSTRAANGEGA